MTDDERRTRQPLSMTRRYRRGLILTGLLCALAVLTAATVLFQRSYAERIDNYLMQICHGYAAAYEAQDTHSATTLLNLLPENLPLRITLIDTDGTVKSFAMNDKCSAGTGRFFEAMARSFEMSLPEFSNLSLSAKNVIPITAQCTVFAESEVITLVGEGKPMDEIAAGIQMAVAKRCFVMSKKAGATDAITLTGGCAKNAGLKQAIEHVLKFKVVDLKTDPQLMGALGAAEYARQKGLAKK